MELENILNKYPGKARENLIPILQDVQDEIGYLSKDSARVIGKYLSLPVSKIYSVATFFNQFQFHPKGRYHIIACNGTTCHLSSSEEIINELKKILSINVGETTKDGNFSLELTTCIGACGHAPVIAINGEYYPRITKKRLHDIINTLKDPDNA